MKFGSLFSGIGGMDLGLERAGMQCAWQVEIDDYCQRVLNKHWPEVSKYGDVRNVGRGNLETVDLIAGGFPCQPHSVAGKRKGAADNRNLWPEFSRIIAELQPRYVLAENVPGIITTYIDTVLSDLEGQGYICTTFNLPALAFDAPHRRERIFIVAYSEQGTSRGRAIVRESNGQGRQFSEAKRESIQPRHGEAHPSESQSSSEAVAYPRGYGVAFNRESQPYQAERGNGRRISPDDRGKLWEVEPDVGRVAHGVPSRMDRLRGLGNAVVPQVAEWIGRRILEFDGTP